MEKPRTISWKTGLNFSLSWLSVRNAMPFCCFQYSCLKTLCFFTRVFVDESTRDFRNLECLGLYNQKLSLRVLVPVRQSPISLDFARFPVSLVFYKREKYKKNFPPVQMTTRWSNMHTRNENFGFSVSNFSFVCFFYRNKFLKLKLELTSFSASNTRNQSISQFLRTRIIFEHENF